MAKPWIDESSISILFFQGIWHGGEKIRKNIQYTILTCSALFWIVITKARHMGPVMSQWGVSVHYASLLLRARLAQLGWPCYRIFSVMPHPDGALKTGVCWPRAWPFPTVSNVALRWPITDQLALSSSILPRVTHEAIVWQPRGGAVYCLNLVYKVNDILFKHVGIGQQQNWVKLMNISNITHYTVQ